MPSSVRRTRRFPANYCWPCVLLSLISPTPQHRGTESRLRCRDPLSQGPSFRSGGTFALGRVGRSIAFSRPPLDLPGLQPHAVESAARERVRHGQHERQREAGQYDGDADVADDGPVSRRRTTGTPTRSKIGTAGRMVASIQTVPGAAGYSPSRSGGPRRPGVAAVPGSSRCASQSPPRAAICHYRDQPVGPPCPGMAWAR